MIAIISDVHGNYPALKAVLDEIDSLNCSLIVSLGDVAGYYCMVNECIDELRNRNVVNIMGNHDYYMVSGTRCPRSNSANDCIDFQNKILRAENRQWLAGSVASLTLDKASMVHAGWNDPLDEYLDNLHKDYFLNKSGQYFFSGHTHVQLKVDFGSKTYCNPGSVGQPRDGDKDAAFALFDKGRVILRRVDYNIDDIARAMEEAGFNTYYYQNLYSGSRIGGLLSKVNVVRD